MNLWKDKKSICTFCTNFVQIQKVFVVSVQIGFNEWKNEHYNI